MRTTTFFTTRRLSFSIICLGTFLLSQTILANTPCGLEGTIEERIEDCSLKSPITKANHTFKLVSRLEELNGAEREIYLDTKTGLIWTDRLASEFTYERALEVCSESKNNRTGGITEVTWDIPTIDNYNEAEKNGIRRALPRMDDVFWTSTVWGEGFSGGAFFFMGKIGAESYGGRYIPRSVRCVGQWIK
jgi:hypothetical protein